MLPAQSRKTDETLIARRTRLLGPAYRLFYEEPLHIVRGEGAWLYDAAGRRYLDAYNNVAAVGHAHPHVVDAIARQAAVLNTHTRYLHDGVLDYAERLLGTMPAEIGHTIFTCTGSEANDLAMRIARAFTGNDGLIVTRFAYHGVTEAIATASPSLGQHVRLGEHVRTVPAPDSLRVPSNQLGAFFADGVRAAVADLRAHGKRPAALLVDTVFSSDGIYTDPPGFLQDAVAAVRAAGGLFIADEVQPGLGRTGDAFWGFQRHGVVPDIVTMGKPMGNGHPLAGLAVKPDVLAPFAQQCRYFNTFGGNPVSVAAGMAVLDVIERENLIASVRLVGEHLRTRLRAVAARYPQIRDVRGAGLFVGVEFGDDDGDDRGGDDGDGDPSMTARVQRIVNGMRKHGVLLNATGPNANILKIRPPMVFDAAQADLLVDTLEDVMQEVLAGGHDPARSR